MELFTCICCQKSLPLTEFRKNKAQKSGHASRCKLCDKQIKEWQNRIKFYTPTQNRELFLKMYTSNFKNFKVRQYALLFNCSNEIIYNLLKEYNIFRCPKCNQLKKLDTDFFKSSQESHGYMFVCKDCVNTSSNLENKRLISKEWSKNHKEYHKMLIKKWQQEHKNDPKTPEQIEHKRKYYRDHMKYRRDTEPQFKLNHNFGTAVWLSLKNKNISKDYIKWEKLVDYTLDDLVKHLESKFQSGMTWDNYGEWHIDHIIPKTAFHYESYDDPEFKKCWVLENLQPLWALDNQSKSNKIGPEWGNDK